MLGEIISELRKDKGIYQKDLAELLGVSIGTISNYETGTHTPDIDSLIKLADYFNISVDYLIGHTKLELPINDFSNDFVSGVKVYNFINRIRKISMPNRKLLLDYLSLLELKESSN